MSWRGFPTEREMIRHLDMESAAKYGNKRGTSAAAPLSRVLPACVTCAGVGHLPYPLPGECGSGELVDECECKDCKGTGIAWWYQGCAHGWTDDGCPECRRENQQEPPPWMEER